jgi:hypothetical protein
VSLQVSFGRLSGCHQGKCRGLPPSSNAGDRATAVI